MKKIILAAFVTVLAAGYARAAEDGAREICDSFYVDYTDTSSGLYFQFFDASFTPGGVLITDRRWYFDDPASDSANTSGALEPEHIFTSAGTYNVCLAADAKLPAEPGGTDIYCYDSICKSVTVVNTGIVKTKIADNGYFYPNPTHDFIYWKGDVIEIKDLVLYDLTGRRWLSIKKAEREVALPGDCPAGVYVLRYYSDGELKQQTIEIR